MNLNSETFDTIMNWCMTMVTEFKQFRGVCGNILGTINIPEFNGPDYIKCVFLTRTYRCQLL